MKENKQHINKMLKNINLLTPTQKERFRSHLPEKVYYTERNISILVALSQVCMILIFLTNKKEVFQSFRAVAYFSLYIYLLAATCLALVLYRYTFRNKKYAAFIWLRRFYAFFLCIWVIGITFLEQLHGKGLSVFCYLLPTTAALLLLSPIESLAIFGSAWVGLVAMLAMVSGKESRFFGDFVNSIFVTVLTLFISYRYYRSMAKEFCARETIADQYEEIQKKNRLLQQIVHIDQLTGLYNRHYLLENIYPQYADCKENHYTGMILMMDIDYFKQYNDTYGHVQGDECLRKLSAVLRRVCQNINAAAIRYGGEEFLVIKLEEQPFSAEQYAEGMLQAIRDEAILREDVGEGRVTVSVGYWYGSLLETEHIEAAIKFADSALYQAKSSGRNRIVRYEP